MGFENLKSTIANLNSKLSSSDSRFPTPDSRFSIIVLAALAIILGVWWLERDASLRRDGAIKEIQRQTAAEVAALRARADAAVRDANQSNAHAASELEASRRLLAKQSQNLREKLDALQTAEETRIAQVAVLPASEIVKRLGEQLGPGGIEPLKDRESEVRSQESGGRKSETRNQNGPDSGLGQNPQPKAQNLKSETSSPDSGLLTPDSFFLTDAGARKVETAFVELASCRERSALQAQQLATCEKEGTAEREMVEQQKASIAQLNQALGDKDEILAKRESEFKSELKVARGTWLSRASRTALHVAIGVGIGLVVR